jgi:hypothetical protein
MNPAVTETRPGDPKNTDVAYSVDISVFNEIMFMRSQGNIVTSQFHISRDSKARDGP